MIHRLAIVIPAYKATFLKATLDSIAVQTCQDFTLYIGDDCSPEPIGDIVEQYRDKVDLVYQRFSTNVGAKDLVAQWARCIAMSKDEPYIWLFSDDDVMEPNCVEELFRQIDETKGTYDLYHFDVNEINDKSEVTRSLPEYPQVLGAYDFYKGKTSGRYRSYVVENVFSRRIYEQTGGFRNFDLAWGSDVATWCIFCGKNGIYKVPDAHVLWRRSSQNITPDRSKQTAERKLMANCALLNWANYFFKDEQSISKINNRIFIRLMRRYGRLVGRDCRKRAFESFFNGYKNQGTALMIEIMTRLPQPLYRLLQNYI